ncbi:BLUF domain-containing protein [Octadecabacter arcticus]|nr:BLUF domain-containing protein [Octadecabacter arcticus]
MLKISAGNEEFGLCGKWLLHGFKIAKLNLQGNPRLMQRSHSTAYADISAADVYEIATRSSEANIENKITGALAFDGEKFCQCLEGKHESVQNLIETIQKDGRNSDLEVIAEKAITVRYFGDWSMLYVDGQGFSPVTDAMNF